MAGTGAAARAGVTVSAIVHETESEAAVLAALSDMLGVDADGVRRSAARGHFGNRIVTLSASVAHPRSAAALRTVRDALAWRSREEAIEGARGALGDGSLSVRLDKQELVRRRASLGGERGGGGDVVVRVAVRASRGADAAEALAGLLWP